MLAKLKNPGGIARLLRIYESLRKEYDREYLQKVIDLHCHKGDIVYRETASNGQKPQGPSAVGFYWHIRDPYDVVDDSGYPGEDPNGKYIFFPVLWVRKDLRGDGRLLRLLVNTALKRCPAASRIAFFRTRSSRRLVVLRMKHADSKSDNKHPLCV